MSLFDGIGKLQGGLDYHLARQNLLVSNLSHLDTPGYRPKDLERTTAASFQGALSAAIHAENGGGALTVTNAAHLPGRQGTSTDFGRVVTDPTAKSGPDGNAVNVDREASKIAANQVRYDVLARLVQGELSGLAWAANDGRNG